MEDRFIFTWDNSCMSFSFIEQNGWKWKNHDPNIASRVSCCKIQDHKLRYSIEKLSEKQRTKKNGSLCKVVAPAFKHALTCVWKTLLRWWWWLFINDTRKNKLRPENGLKGDLQLNKKPRATDRAAVRARKRVKSRCCFSVTTTTTTRTHICVCNTHTCCGVDNYSITATNGLDPYQVANKYFQEPHSHFATDDGRPTEARIARLITADPTWAFEGSARCKLCSCFSIQLWYLRGILKRAVRRRRKRGRVKKERKYKTGGKLGVGKKTRGSKKGGRDGEGKQMPGLGSICHVR